MKNDSKRLRHKRPEHRVASPGLAPVREMMALNGMLLDELDRTLRDTLSDPRYWMVKNTLIARITARLQRNSHT